MDSPIYDSVTLVYDAAYAAFPFTPVILFTGTVNALQVAKLIETMARAVKLQKVKGDTTPILLVINSTGGDTHSGLAAGDFLDQLPWPVVTLGQGRVASAATHIFLAGRARFMTHNSVLLIHQLRTGMPAFPTFSELCNSVRKNVPIMRMIVDAYTSHTHMGRAAIEKQLDVEQFWTASECVANTFATGVLEGDGYVDAGGVKHKMAPLLETLDTRGQAWPPTACQREAAGLDGIITADEASAS